MNARPEPARDPREQYRLRTVQRPTLQLPRPAAPPPSAAEPKRGAALATLGFDIAVPIGVYYGMRAAGCTTFAALVVSAIPPALSALVQLVRSRRTDPAALFIAFCMAASAVAGVLGGSDRTLLARDGWVTALFGLWFLGSACTRRPLLYHAARPLLEGRFRSDGTPWEVLWGREPQFRRIWRVSTVIWGVAMLADSAVRIAMACTLPVDRVPALGALLWPVTLVLLQFVGGVYYARAGLWRITAGSTAAPSTSTPTSTEGQPR